MKKTTRLLLVMLLALALVFVLAGCPQEEKPDVPDVPDVPDTPDNPDNPGTGASADALHKDEGYYTWNTYASVLAANWNNHTYETADDGEPIGYITTGFLEFFFNETYDGYEIKPAAAADFPVDVTADYKDDWNLPGDEGYAYSIKLNENLTWENGEKITADDYVESLRHLFDPAKSNYRASDYIDGDFAFAGAYEYFWSGKTEQKSVHTDYSLDPDTTEMYINVDTYKCSFFGYPWATYYNGGYADFFMTEEFGDVFAKYTGKGDVRVTSDMIPELTAVAQAFGDMNPDAWREFCFYNYVHEEVEFESVGIRKIDDYEIVVILDKYLSGFYLHYNLTGNWLVYLPYYEANANIDEETGYYTNTYNTSVSTTMSYGPYKMTYFQAGKQMIFERNEAWFGYDSANYDEMYMTDKVVYDQISDIETVKMLFESGKLMTYSLQSADFNEGYRESDRAYFTTGDTAFFFTLNGVKTALEGRETETVNKTMMLNAKFRQAMALCVNKDDFAATVSPARSAAYGLIGPAYIANPLTGETYRETDAAKEVLCRYYGISYGQPGDLYATLDEAVEAITGYDAELARKLFLEAYEEELAAGRITAEQVITIEYALSAESALINRLVEYMNNNFNTILAGTVLENRIMFTQSAPLGNNWSTELKQGTVDTCLCGWQGARMNPFGLSDLYVNPSKAYDAAWFNAGTAEMTLVISDETAGLRNERITMSLSQWSDCLNGAVVEIDGKSYNFGDGMCDYETRVQILAEFEYAILSTGSYIPTMQDASMFLLTRKVEYVTQREDPVLAYGGFSYAIYNFTDAEWDAYVEENGGTVSYK